MKDRPIEAEQQREAAALAALGRTLASIARSRFDLDEVLQAVVEEAAQLCHADSANIAVRDGNAYRMRAFTGFSPEFEELVRGVMYAPDRESVVGRAILDGRVVHMTAGTSYQVADCAEPHRSETKTGAKLFIVD